MSQQTHKYHDLQSFLYKHKKTGNEYTHNALGNPPHSYPGSYNIPPELNDTFLDLYIEHVFNRKKNSHLTESHSNFSPILIDLDFRFKGEVNERKYTQDDLKQFLECYIVELEKYVNIEDCDLTAFIMEKSKPVYISKKSITKDGVHIIFPYLISEPKLQHILRHKIIQNSECKELFEKRSIINPIDDIYDASVIEKNGWLLYGSKKPDGEPYKVTNVLEYNYEDKKLVKSDSKFNERDYVRLFSIRERSKDECVEIKEEMLSKLDRAFEKLPVKHKVKKRNKLKKKKNSSKKNKCDNIEFVKKLIKILSEERANGFEDWIRVGWCLHNIDFRLLDNWIEFSKKSQKFEEGSCNEHWENMETEGLSLGTLRLWAKTDNKEEYDKIVNEDIEHKILTSLNETHSDVGKVVHLLYKNEFVCCSLKKKKWYHYTNHKWKLLDDGIELRKRISSDVVNQYLKVCASISKRAADMEEGHPMKDVEMAKIKKLSRISLKLRTSSFKKNVFDECCELFHVDKFEETLDNKDHLVCFNNGVYDLNLGEFREGIPEDYVSYCTNIDYINYKEDAEADEEELNDVWKFLEQVLPIDAVRDYVITLFSSFLSGKNNEEKFHVWTGCGGNGKSKIIELFEACFGEYCCKLPVTIITRTRGSGEAASPAVARTKGKRFACLQEPEKDEEINVGLMKELTGGDKIMARGLHQDPFEFKPKFKMVLTCNYLPRVSSNDRGTWRRIRVVEFISKFTENPSEDPADHEYPIDYDLAEKLKEWPQAFMFILTQYYELYRKFGIKEPKEVTIQTSEYENDSDIFKQFFNSKIVELEEYDGKGLSLDDAYIHFIAWLKQSSPTTKCPSRKDLKANMIKKYGKCETSKSIWKGISCVISEQEFIKDEENDLDNDI